jgi:hypothetical protein
VAQSMAAMCHTHIGLKFMHSAGLDPTTFGAGEETWEGPLTDTPPHVPCNINDAYYIYVEMYYMVGADRARA